VLLLTVLILTSVPTVEATFWRLILRNYLFYIVGTGLVPVLSVPLCCLSLPSLLSLTVSGTQGEARALTHHLWPVVFPSGYSILCPSYWFPCDSFHCWPWMHFSTIYLEETWNVRYLGIAHILVVIQRGWCSSCWRGFGIPVFWYYTVSVKHSVISIWRLGPVVILR
jgi:hypothetical protein